MGVFRVFYVFIRLVMVMAKTRRMVAVFRAIRSSGRVDIRLDSVGS